MAEFVAGLVAGFSQSVVAQPFDFVKTRMQASSTTYRSTTHCIHHTLKHEGQRIHGQVNIHQLF